MVNDKEIESDYFSSTKPEFYRLAETTKLRETKLKHEILCGDLYAAFELTGKLQFWDAPKDEDEFGLIPDRKNDLRRQNYILGSG